MAKYGTIFANKPIVCHPIDTPDEVYEIAKKGNKNFDSNFKSYKDYYIQNIEPLLFNSPFKMNLGGENEKQRIITTERTSGIFDFSLASKTLQKDFEYYSERLAKEYPDRFQNMGLLSGIVPDTLITNFPVQGQPNFIFQDDLTKQDFICDQRQKGETAIEQGIKGATKVFKSTTRKIYKTYKRNKGKVRYVEIYSLFYYTSLSGDLQYAIRHFPAILAAQYFESQGIKTRIYVTRFVELTETYGLLKYDSVSKLELPQYNLVEKEGNLPLEQRKALFVQPFCVKDFGDETDPALGFYVSSARGSNDVYKPLAKYALKRESTIYDIYGEPNWSEFQYMEGVDRYKNKYKEYVDKGIYKSKEVLPEAMFYFHDMSIKNNLSKFVDAFTEVLNKLKLTSTKPLQHPKVNIIFTWWMRILATKIKHKVDLLNTSSLSNEMRNIDKDLENFRSEAKNVYESETERLLKDQYKFWFDLLIEATYIKTLYEYVTAINNEITAYSQKYYYQTSEEDIEKRDDFAQNINEALNSYL